jgi:hypothetical protein
MALCLGSVRAASPKPDSSPRFELGANVNETLTRLDKDLLDRSQTIWVRGFLPATEFITGKRSVTNDPGIQALQRCAREGRKVIVSLKWDFKEAHWRVPATDSERERECFAFATSVMKEMRGQISIFALVNEVFVDTPREDMQADAEGTIPMVRFLQRLTAHIAAQSPKDPRGQPLPLSCGGFTRLDLEEMQQSPAALALLRWCDSDPRLAIVNYHLHQRNYDQWNESLQFIRRHVATKPIIVTEFSLVWNYKAHLEDRLDVTAAGADFARKHKLLPETTVRDYINQCMTHPVPEATWMDFLHTQSWHDPEFLSRVSDLMRTHGVTVATYAFSQRSSGGGRPLSADSTPWLLNPIFIPSVAVAPKTGETAVNTDWFATYLQRQQTVSKSAAQAQSTNHSVSLR